MEKATGLHQATLQATAEVARVFFRKKGGMSEIGPSSSS
jgi:hypothetical protein